MKFRSPLRRMAEGSPDTMAGFVLNMATGEPTLRERVEQRKAELRRVIEIHQHAHGSGGSTCDCTHYRGEHDWTTESECEVNGCECTHFSMNWLVEEHGLWRLGLGKETR